MATTGQTRAERQAARADRRITTGGGRGTRKGRKKSKHELRKEVKNLRRATWKANAGTSSNRKSKTGRRGGQVRLGASHPDGKCGNLGCGTCNPLLTQHVRTNPKSCDVRREGGMFAQ